MSVVSPRFRAPGRRWDLGGRLGTVVRVRFPAGPQSGYRPVRDPGRSGCDRRGRGATEAEMKPQNYAARTTYRPPARLVPADQLARRAPDLRGAGPSGRIPTFRGRERAGTHFGGPRETGHGPRYPGGHRGPTVVQVHESAG